MKTILVAVDFSEGTERLVHQAEELGRDLGGRLCFVHVTSDALQAAYESTQFYDVTSDYVSVPNGDVELARDLCADQFRREHESLLNLSARMREGGIEARSMLLKGNAAELILEKARELDADMIMMASHGHGLLRKMLLGSVAEAVLRSASCNVLIVPVMNQAPVL